MNKQNRKTGRYREQIDGCQKRGGLGHWVKMVKVLASTDRYLQNSQGDIRYNIGNTVKNIVLTVYGARWGLDISGGSTL